MALVLANAIAYEAFSAGWVEGNSSGRGSPTDFLVMTAIVNHARPLHGEDLRLLIRLGVATEADEGRLYARVADVGLAGEPGCGRDTGVEGGSWAHDPPLKTDADIDRLSLPSSQ